MKFLLIGYNAVLMTSLPSRERGLKSVYNKLYESSLLVAPFAGAWIEIILSRDLSAMNESLPSRERGLKSSILDTENASSLSLPSRERGLKLQMSNLLPAYLRRSLRGSVD